jgi:DNA polymerase-3 subunit epsilon
MQLGDVLASGSSLVHPGVQIPPAATFVHGIRDCDVADAPTIVAAWSEVSSQLDTCRVVGAYNWPYDSAILERLLGPLWLFRANVSNLIVDPLVVARYVGKHWAGSGRHRLGEVVKRLGIVVEGALHRARADAVAAGKVLWELRDHLPTGDADVANFMVRGRRAQTQERQEYLERKRRCGGDERRKG